MAPSLMINILTKNEHNIWHKLEYYSQNLTFFKKLVCFILFEQLQLSEVIMRARKFACEIVGQSGNVMGHNLNIEDLEKRLMQAGITDTKKFLEKVTTDSQG